MDLKNFPEIDQWTQTEISNWIKCLSTKYEENSKALDTLKELEISILLRRNKIGDWVRCLATFPKESLIHKMAASISCEEDVEQLKLLGEVVDTLLEKRKYSFKTLKSNATKLIEFKNNDKVCRLYQEIADTFKTIYETIFKTETEYVRAELNSIQGIDKNTGASQEEIEKRKKFYEGFELEVKKIIDSKFRVLVVGDTNAGKTTFICALFRKADCLPILDGPCTAQFVELAHGIEERIKFANQENWSKLSSDTKSWASDKKFGFDPKNPLIVEMDVDILNYITVVDSPGLSDEKAFSEAVIEMSKTVDLNVILINGSASLGERNKELLKSLNQYTKDHPEKRRSIFVMCNKADMIKDPSKQLLIRNEISQYYNLENNLFFINSSAAYDSFSKDFVSLPKDFANAESSLMDYLKHCIVSRMTHVLEQYHTRFIPELQTDLDILLKESELKVVTILRKNVVEKILKDVKHCLDLLNEWEKEIEREFGSLSAEMKNEWFDFWNNMEQKSRKEIEEQISIKQEKCKTDAEALLDKVQKSTLLGQALQIMLQSKESLQQASGTDIAEKYKESKFWSFVTVITNKMSKAGVVGGGLGTGTATAVAYEVLQIGFIAANLGTAFVFSAAAIGAGALGWVITSIVQSNNVEKWIKENRVRVSSSVVSFVDFYKQIALSKKREVEEQVNNIAKESNLWLQRKRNPLEMQELYNPTLKKLKDLNELVSNALGKKIVAEDNNL